MNLRSFAPAALLVSLFGLAQGPSPSPITILSKDGRRPLAVTVAGDQEFVGLDDLAAAFQLSVREETLGAITVSYKGKTIVLTTDQALASISGKLISLPASPMRSGRRTLVPVEFVSRALATVYDTKLDLRKPSRLLIVGDLRVPRITVRYDPAATTARVTIDATPAATSTVTQQNDRLLVKFDADALDLAPLPAIQAGGLVQAVRQADPLTLEVDLGPRFAAFRASAQPVDTTTRLTLDVVAGGAAQTDASPTPSPAPSGPPPPLPDLSGVGQPPAIRTLAIDPGHGGDDDGVVGPGGTKEKDLTLAIARRLKSAFEARLGIRVLLTREDDRAVALDDRAAAANNNKADVFLSLHASASMRPGSTGAAIFFASFAQDVIDAENASRAAERLPTFTGGVREIELVRWNFAQIRHLGRSEQLAHLVEQQFHDHVPLAPHPVDRAPLRVLGSANMPALLIELGYLTNADQEKQLTSNEFQNACVQAIVEAVVKFRDVLTQ